jgi:hypothetical protein
MSGSPAAARSVGNQSWREAMSFSTRPGLIWPGQRTKIGTRQPPSQLVLTQRELEKILAATLTGMPVGLPRLKNRSTALRTRKW